MTPDTERGRALHIVGEGIPGQPDACVALCGEPVPMEAAIAYDDDSLLQATCAGCVIKFIVAESEARETE